MRQVYCKKLQKKAKGLDFPPLPGEIGQRIYQHISKEAWAEWLKLQTMFINENRLNTLDPKARSFLREKMEEFLFGKGVEKPQGYQQAKEKTN